MEWIACNGVPRKKPWATLLKTPCCLCPHGLSWTCWIQKARLLPLVLQCVIAHRICLSLPPIPPWWSTVNHMGSGSIQPFLREEVWTSLCMYAKVHVLLSEEFCFAQGWTGKWPSWGVMPLSSVCICLRSSNARDGECCQLCPRVRWVTQTPLSDAEGLGRWLHPLEVLLMCHCM